MSCLFTSYGAKAFFKNKGTLATVSKKSNVSGLGRTANNISMRLKLAKKVKSKPVPHIHPCGGAPHIQNITKTL